MKTALRLLLALLIAALPAMNLHGSARAGMVVNPYTFGGGAPAPAVDVSLTATASSGTNGTSFTFSAQPLGAADSGRHIVVGIGAGLAASGTVTAVTVGGVSASELVSAMPNSFSRAALWIAAVPSGTTGDVVITLNVTAARLGIGVWRTTGVQSTTPTDTGSSGAGPLNDTLNIDAKGAAFGVAYSQASTTGTWTNLDEATFGFDFTTNLEGDTFSGAADEFASSQTSLSITATWGSSSVPVMVIASLR